MEIRSNQDELPGRILVTGSITFYGISVESGRILKRIYPFVCLLDILIVSAADCNYIPFYCF